MSGGNVGRRIKFEGHLGAVNDIALSPDGTKVLTGGDDGVRLWSPSRSKTPRDLLGHEGAVLRVAISADGKLGVTAGKDKVLRIWEITSKEPELGGIAFPGHEDEVLALVLDGPRGDGDPRPNLALSGSSDGTARTWNLDSRAQVVESTPLGPHRGEVRAVAFSPDGHAVLTGDVSGAARIWPHESPGADGASLVGRAHRQPVTAVAINPAATRMVSTSADGSAVVWDLTKPGRIDIVDVLEGHSGAVDAVAINVDGKFAATADGAGGIRLWDLTKAEPGKASLPLAKHRRGVKQLLFTPDGMRMLSLSSDAVWVWKLSAKPDADAQKLTHSDELVTMSLSADGRWLMTGSVRSMRLWDLDAAAIAKTGKALKKVHELDIAAVAVGPEGKWAASSGKDATLFLWNLDKGGKAKQLYLHEKQVDALAFSADGNWLATGSRDNTVRLWDMRQAHPESKSLLLEGHAQRIGVLQFSADSRWLLSGSNDKTMRVWDLQSEDQGRITSTAVVLEGHQALVSSAQLSADGRMVVSGSYDTTARAWPLTPHSLIAIGCRTVGRSLTEEEWDRFFPGKPIERTCG
jgi:WD40 repeat protein